MGLQAHATTPVATTPVPFVLPCSLLVWGQVDVDGLLLRHSFIHHSMEDMVLAEVISLTSALSHIPCNFKGLPGFNVEERCIYQVTFKYGFVFTFELS